MNAETLRAAFSYDPETGHIERKDSARKRRPHTGTVNHRKDTSYSVLCIDHRRVYAHRVAWMLVHGDIPGSLVIDHINGNGLDNRLANLRLVTKTVNQRNRRDMRAGRLLGVYFDHRKNGWKVQFGGKHAAWSPDFFEACCARKSLEARALTEGVSK